MNPTDDDYFEPPTVRYCEELKPLDDEMCRILQKRMEISKGDPGFPPIPLIEQWASKYGVSPRLVRSLFNVLYYQSQAEKIQIQPEGFQRLVPILRSESSNGATYTVLSTHQYKNASVIRIVIEIEGDLSADFPRLELDLGPNYEVRGQHGSGSRGVIEHDFVVIPPVPDDLFGVNFELRVTPSRHHPSHREEPRYSFSTQTVLFNRT